MMRSVVVSTANEANHIASQYFPGHQPLLGCLVSIGACLALLPSLTLCSAQQAASPASTPAAQGAVLTGPIKRSVTVADSIQMTRLGDSSYADGTPAKELVAKFSPDGSKFVTILKKGNLEANTNEYSLVLFRTAQAFQSPAPQVLVSLASSSNR